MTSEIRANTIKNRVGLGTVSFTNTGPVVSGIVTAEVTSITLINKENALNTLLTVENTLTGNAGVRIKNADGEFTFLANERLRIQDEGAGGIERVSMLSGNVGINSTSPKARLDVNGNLSITGVSTFSGSITAHDFRSGGGVGNTLYLTSADDWRFRTTGGAERFRISSTGVFEATSGQHDGGLEILSGNNNQSTRLRIQSKSSK